LPSSNEGHLHGAFEVLLDGTYLLDGFSWRTPGRIDVRQRNSCLRFLRSRFCFGWGDLVDGVASGAAILDFHFHGFLLDWSPREDEILSISKRAVGPILLQGQPKNPNKVVALLQDVHIHTTYVYGPGDHNFNLRGKTMSTQITISNSSLNTLKKIIHNGKTDISDYDKRSVRALASRGLVKIFNQKSGVFVATTAKGKKFLN
jgi:hypothetical protein